MDLSACVRLPTALLAIAAAIASSGCIGASNQKWVRDMAETMGTSFVIPVPAERVAPLAREAMQRAQLEVDAEDPPAAGKVRLFGHVGNRYLRIIVVPAEGGAPETLVRTFAWNAVVGGEDIGGERSLALWLYTVAFERAVGGST